MNIPNISKIIRSEFPKIEANTTVSEIISIFLDGFESVPVFDNKKFHGIVSINDLIIKDYDAKAKVGNIARKNIPKCKEDINFIEAAKLFLNNDIKAVPIFSGENLTGLLLEKDLIRNSKLILSEVNKTTKDVANMPDIISINDTIGKARKLIRDNKISRIPVIDENRKLVGIVDSTDFLKTINPKNSDKETIMGDAMPEHKLSITTIMDKIPLTVENHIPLKDAVELMEKHNKSYVLITSENEPIGIVTPKDILEVIASMEEKKGVYVQIAGLDNIENSFDKEKISKMIEDSIQKIGKMFDNLEYMFVHIKSQKNEGGDRLYSTRARISTPLGLFVSKASNWNPVGAINETLNKLERQIIEEREKRVTVEKPRNP